MQKLILAAALVLSLPALALAQAAPKADAKPAAKAATTPAKKTQAAPRKVQPKLARSAVKAVEEVTPVSDEPAVELTADELAIADRVYLGPIKCELGANVVVTADDKRPGFFTVQTQRVRYRMHPVVSRTGAIRLEDPRAGAMWLQLGNKSMLLNQKIGERLADECQSPQQMAFAEEMKKNPPRGLFDQGTPAAKN